MDKPLVSIYTLTYNSSKTIMEAMESVKALQYPNIEYIISDDASKDDTVEICKKWIEANRDRFVDVKLLTVEKNTGVAKNFHRAISAATGEWIKSVSGDDALLPDCLKKLFAYVSQHPEAKMILAQTKRYDTYLDEEHFIDIHGSKDDAINKATTASAQYQILLAWACIDAPAVFYHRSVFDIPELQNCGYAGLEDYPRFLTYTRLGNRIYFCEEPIIKYRKSPTSLQITTNFGNLITRCYIQMYFEETHAYYKGLDSLAHEVFYRYQRVLINASDSRTKYNIIRYTLYPLYWAACRLKTYYDYRRIAKALKG